MTGYHFELGYNGATRTDYDEMWTTMKATARKLCDAPGAIVAEARRLGCPENCDDGCCELDHYADNYALPFEAEGHPLKIVEDGENRQIMQMASTDHGIKYHVRRAFARLLIEAMHREAIEVNLVVA